MRRRVTPELMDEPDASRADLDASLRFIRGVNRRLGGVRALTDVLDRLAPDWHAGEPIRVLDIATGSADIPVEAVRWARGRGLDVRVTAVDLHPVTLDLAREYVETELEGDDRGRIELVEADAFGLVEQFGAGSFDVVHAGMFLHHLPEVRVLTMLAIMDRLASRAMVWNDLVRSRVARAGIHVLTLGQPAIVKHDARVSVEAGFTPGEARALAIKAGWEGVAVRSSFLQQRLVVTGRGRDV